MAHLVRPRIPQVGLTRSGIGQLHSITSKNMESQNEGEPAPLHAQPTEILICASALHTNRGLHVTHFLYSVFFSHNFSLALSVQCLSP